jgi:hypothetical protein
MDPGKRTVQREWTHCIGRGGGRIALKLIVLRMFRRKPRYRRPPRKDGVAVYRGDYPVNDEVLAFTPSAAKSKTTKSPGRVASPCLGHHASSSMAPFGPHDSSTIPRSVLISPWCIRCRAPPLGHRGTCRSKASGSPAGRPH